jgi:3-oxoacyl-[acyl-carrier protein] reductase
VSPAAGPGRVASAVTERGCAVVTGGSRGIGAAIARGLAADGWSVGVNYRVDADSAARVVEAIESSGGRAVAVGVDVRDPDAATTLLASVEESLGLPALVLVNNAGIVRDRLVPQLDDESWDAVLDTNLSGAFRMTRRALRSMMRERFGRVVNVASVAGQIANPGQAAYAASKAGLVAFTQTVAVEVARLSITVNAVAPGLIDTDATSEVMSQVLERVPARRAGSPEEVAACVRFLVSEQAGYVTGSVITVDGGLTA